MKMVAAKRSLILAVLLLPVVVWSAVVVAQPGPDETVLVSNSLAKVTRADYEAELLKLAPDIRPGFAFASNASDRRRVYLPK
mgnify:CR=1 FL=1